jgi:formylglycine-generating enzyme required for sulfatase activity
MDIAPKGERGLPKWALWAGIGVVLVVLLGMAIGIGGNLVELGKGGEGPLAMLATPELTLGIEPILINEKDEAEIVYVPPSEFLMGSEGANADSDEAPEHTVFLDAYWVYKHEVTNAQYRQCIEEGICYGDLSWYPENDYPAVYISWYEASDYCEWAGGSLPTEAQWEKAARGEDGQTYPWGEESPTCDLANFYGCEESTMPVGSYPAGVSPYGALDMAGNVWEWVMDWYDAEYYQSSPSQNPTGPVSGSYRVLRGGSLDNIVRNLRASDRDRNYPVNSVSDYGFRCVTTP